MKSLSTKQRSFGLLALAVAGVVTVSLTMASCDNSSDPTSPNKNGGGKGQHVLTHTFAHTVGIDREKGDGSDWEEPDQLDPRLTVHDLGGGISSVMDEPVNTWQQSVEGSWPDDGNGGIRLSSVSDGNQTSSLDITQGDAASDGLTLTADFTGAASEGTFDLVLYNQGTETVIANIPVRTPIPVYPPSNPCCQWPGSWYFGVPQINHGCVWQVFLGRCCGWIVNYGGTSYPVDRIQLRERILPGQYAYHEFDRIDITQAEGRNGVGSLSITNEFAATYP